MSLTLFPVVGVNPKQFEKLTDDSFVAIEGAAAIDSECMLLAVERVEEYYRILFIDTANDGRDTTSLPSNGCNVICTWCHGSEVELVKFPAFFTVNDSLDSGTQVTVRKLASTDSAAITTLTPGSIILVHSVVDNWMQMSLGVPPGANGETSSAPKAVMFWMRRSTDCGILLLLPLIPKCFRRSIGVPLDAALRRRMLPFPNAASIDPPFTGEHVLGVQLPRFPKWVWVVEGFWMMTAMDRDRDGPLVMLEEVPHPTGDGLSPHQLKYVTTRPSVYAGATLRIRAHLPDPDVVETAATVDEVGFFNDREVLCCATLRGKSYIESEINMRASWLYLATGALYAGEEGFCAMNMKNKAGGDNAYNPLLSIINISGIRHRNNGTRQSNTVDKNTEDTSKTNANSFDEAPIKPMKAAAGAPSTSNPYDEAPIKPMKAAADATSTSNPYDEAPIKPMKAAADAPSPSNPYDEAPIKPMKAAADAPSASNPYDAGAGEDVSRASAATSVRKSSLPKSSASAKSRLGSLKQQVTAVEKGGPDDVKLPSTSKGAAAGKPWERGPSNKPKTELTSSETGDVDGMIGREGQVAVAVAVAVEGRKGLTLSESEADRLPMASASHATVEGASSGGRAAVSVPLTVECPDQGNMHRVVSSSTMSSMDSGMRQNISGMHDKEKNVLSDVSPLASPASRTRLSLSLGSLCCRESAVDEHAYSSRNPHAVASPATHSTLNGAPLSAGKEASRRSSRNTSTVTSPTPSGFDSPASFEAARKNFIKPQSKANEGQADCSDGRSKTPSPIRGRGSSVVITGSIVSLLEKFNGSGNRRRSDEKQAGPPPLFDLGEVSPDRTLPSVVKKTRVLGTSRSPSRYSSVPDTSTSSSVQINNNKNISLFPDLGEGSSEASVSSSAFVSASDGSAYHSSVSAPSKLFNHDSDVSGANKHQKSAQPDFTSFSLHSDTPMPFDHKETSSSRSSGAPNRSSVICGESESNGALEKMKSDSDSRQSIGRSNSNGSSKIKSKGSYHDAGRSLQLRSSLSPFSHAKPDISPEWLSMSAPMSADTGGDRLSQETASLLDNDLDDLLYRSLDLGSLRALRPNTNSTATLNRTRTESMLAFVSDN